MGGDFKFFCSMQDIKDAGVQQRLSPADESDWRLICGQLDENLLDQPHVHVSGSAVGGSAPGWAHGTPHIAAVGQLDVDQLGKGAYSCDLLLDRPLSTDFIEDFKDILLFLCHSIIASAANKSSFVSMSMSYLGMT